MDEGVGDGGKSEWLPVMGGIGACALTRKRAHFHLVQPSLDGCLCLIEPNGDVRIPVGALVRLLRD